MSQEPRRRVVVTGLGATTPLGGDVPSDLGGAAGRPVRRPDARARLGRQVRPAGAPSPAPVAVEPPTSCSTGSRPAGWTASGQFALIAAREAWADAGSPEVDPERLGVVRRHRHRRRLDPARRLRRAQGEGPAADLPAHRPDADAERPGRRGRARARRPGRRAHPGHAPAPPAPRRSAYAMDMIRTGRADVVVAGGTEAAIHPLPIAGVRRDAGAVHPQRRARAAPPGRTTTAATASCSARAPAWWCSSPRSTPRPAAPGSTPSSPASGLTSDAHHIAAARPGGHRRRPGDRRRAGATPGWPPADVVHVNAHATSTPVGDVAEAQAIRAALGDATDAVAVSATKSMTGHLLGAAGALEAIATVLALHDRRRAAHHQPRRPRRPAVQPRRGPQATRGRCRDGDIAALNNSFGFGGHNVALAVHGATVQ